MEETAPATAGELSGANVVDRSKLSTSEPVDEDEDDFRVSPARPKEKMQSEEDTEVLKSERPSDFKPALGSPPRSQELPEGWKETWPDNLRELVEQSDGVGSMTENAGHDQGGDNDGEEDEEDEEEEEEEGEDEEVVEGCYFPDLRAHPADLQGCVEGAALASVWVGAKGAREEGCFPCLLLNPSTAPSTALRGFKRLVSKGDARLVLFVDASEQDAGTTQVVTSYGCVDAHKLSKWSSNKQGDKILDICRAAEEKQVAKHSQERPYAAAVGLRALKLKYGV